jgi:hypothetical protein
LMSAFDPLHTKKRSPTFLKLIKMLAIAAPYT